MNIPKGIRIFLMMLVGALLATPCHAEDNAVKSGKVDAAFDFKEFTRDRNFHLNTLKTTTYGPAWADIVRTPTNFLECTGTSIALCYYSGAGPATPCNAKGNLADCTCYAIPKGEKYKVDINAILNLDVYLETVRKCGKDGRKCKPNGSEVAPVCAVINNNTMIPGADMISAFSTYLEHEDGMQISPASCPSAGYAGCMTAPCKTTDKIDPKTKLPLVQCACPVYNGPYQVGQKDSQCTLTGDHLWSAAYTPPPQKPSSGSKPID